MSLTTCPECGSNIQAVATPGRTRRYRRIQVMIPADVEIPTCTGCGRIYADSKLLATLGAEFERQLAATRK